MTMTRISARRTWTCLLLAVVVGCAFSFSSQRTGRCPFHTSAASTRSLLPKLFSSFTSTDHDDRRQRDEQENRELQRRLVKAIVDSDDSLVELTLVGRAMLPTSRPRRQGSNNSAATTPCLVFLPSSETNNPWDEDNSFSYNSRQQNQRRGSSNGMNAVVIPVTFNQLKLVSVAVKNQPTSKSVLISALNPLLVNRDGGLFDNLPWASWTVDPQQRNRDAAGNVIDSKFHMGKRDAFNVMTGKDWKGRSVSIGNLAMRLKYSMENSTEEEETSSSLSDQIVLVKRILNVQRKELQEELANYDYELAIAQQEEDYDAIDYLAMKRNACLEQLKSVCDNMEELAAEADASSAASMTRRSRTMLGNILDRIASATTKDGSNEAPYRGAMGYAPKLDSKMDIEESILPYTSPFDLLREIMEDQLNAQVIGTLIENTSLLDGTIALGGAIILQRRMPSTEVKVDGRIIGTVRDETENYGNEVLGGEVILVECDIDEAVGMAIATKTEMQMESSILERSSQPFAPAKSREVTEEDEGLSVYEILPVWESEDDLSLLVEGQATNQSSTSVSSPVRIPRTTMSLFDVLFEPPSPQNQPAPSMFPTDNPIVTLDDMDGLSNADKALTLLQLSNFNDKLPRPRVVQQFERDTAGKSNRESVDHPLNKLLVPLIDESARRQFLIRDALNQGDFERAQELEVQASKRQEALEMASSLRDAGMDDEAAKWEAEADLYGAIRADVTQDEGSYSRFLDKDEWYQRSLESQRKRTKKRQFGTLLDGIE